MPITNLPDIKKRLLIMQAYLVRTPQSGTVSDFYARDVGYLLSLLSHDGTKSRVRAHCHGSHIQTIGLESHEDQRAD